MIYRLTQSAAALFGAVYLSHKIAAAPLAMGATLQMVALVACLAMGAVVLAVDAFNKESL